MRVQLCRCDRCGEEKKIEGEGNALRVVCLTETYGLTRTMTRELCAACASRAWETMESMVRPLYEARRAHV